MYSTSELRTKEYKKAVSMPRKYTFKEGEKVLCINGLSIYEGKCLGVEADARCVNYYVHYIGWNKKWDEWLPESHILKYTLSNLRKMNEIKGAVRIKARTQRRRSRSGGKYPGNKACASTSLAEKSTSGKNKAPTPSTSQEAYTSLAEKSTSGKNKAPTPSTSQEASHEVIQNKEKEQFTTRVEVKIPDELKSLLVDDWEFICSRKKLMKLPSKVTVDEILENFVKHETSKNEFPNKKIALTEVTQGIREYFNILLGRQLLYEFERPQYTKILKVHPGVPMSRIYGASHLLRFFATLGRVLPRTPGDERNIQRLLAHIHNFLRYLNKNRTMLFTLKEYAIAGRKIRKKQ